MQPLLLLLLLPVLLLEALDTEATVSDEARNILLATQLRVLSFVSVHEENHVEDHSEIRIGTTNATLFHIYQCGK